MDISRPHTLDKGATVCCVRVNSLFGIQEEITIEDNQYGDLFIIRWQKGNPSLSIEHVGE